MGVRGAFVRGLDAALLVSLAIAVVGVAMALALDRGRSAPEAVGG
jgi:hypothetical protein